VEVAGVRDERLGTKLLLAHGAEVSARAAAACFKAMNEGAPGYERLQGVIDVGDVPRTEIGKVDWPELRRRLEGK
jgi:hypothetical protein